jgi:hypothetical protein
LEDIMLVASRSLASRATLITVFAAAAASAQDIQYSSVMKVDLGGAMNAMLRMAGASEVKETSYIKGKRLRSDGEKQSLIFDLDNSRYIILNHAEKTYMSVPLSAMATVATSSVRGMRADRSSSQLKGSHVDSAGNKADFTVDVKVDPTKERRTINGMDAERVLITMQTDVDVTPQGETQAQNAGKLVVLMDTWNSNTGPASDAVRAWEQAASKEVAAAAFGSRGNLGPAFASNPKMAEAMKKANEEAQKVDGIAVKTVMHLVIVGPDQKFDRELALREAEGGGSNAAGGSERPRGIRGMIGRAIEASAQQQQQQGNKKADEQKTQVTFAKVTTDILDVRSTSVPASMFEIPAGYREVSPTPRG